MKRRCYVFQTGARLVIMPDRTCIGIPGYCPFISVPITRADAALALRTLRDKLTKVER